MYALCLSYFDKTYKLNCYYVVTALDSRLIEVVHHWLSDYSGNYKNDAEALFKAMGSVVGSIIKSTGIIDAIYSDSVPEYKEFDLEAQLNDNIVFLFFRDGEIEVSLGKYDDYMSQDEFLAMYKPKDTENSGNNVGLPGSLYFDIRGGENEL